MCKLFKIEYTAITIPMLNNSNQNNTIRSATKSLLDTESNLNKIEHYISEKPVSKDIDVLT